MILDSSVVVAVVTREAGFEALLDKLRGATALGIGTATLVECGIVLESRLGVDARSLLQRFVSDFEVSAIPFDEAHWGEALDAFRRFGRGRHRAGLNFGDCLSYATARVAGEPLLFTGGDFAATDLEIA